MAKESEHMPKKPKSAKGSRSIGSEDLRKIQALLKSKASGAPVVALGLMQSLGATPADYDAVFTKSVMQAVLHKNTHQSWATVVRALSPHPQLCVTFHRLACVALRVTDEVPCETIRTLLGHRFPVAPSACGTWPGLLWYQGWRLNEETLAFDGADEQLMSSIIDDWNADLEHEGEGVLLPYCGDDMTMTRVTLSAPEGEPRDTAEYYVHNLQSSRDVLQWCVGNHNKVIALTEQD